ncbi:MAG: type I restriction-modification system endonuclease [Chloroflexota bacterium]|jgi:type I restriction enzyme R subunit
MNLNALPPTNFAFLRLYDEQLVRLGMLAEKYFADDPNTCLLKIRQFAELLAQEVAARTGESEFEGLSQYELLRRLQEKDTLPREVGQIFGEIRRMGNAANHAVEGDHQSALTSLKLAWQLGIWFHRTFKNPNFKSGAFIPPSAPQDQSLELHDELQRLKKELQEHQQIQLETSQNLDFLSAKLQEAQSEQAFWEQMAHDAEQAKSDLAKRLTEQQPATTPQAWIKSARAAATHLHLDEASTRQLIDEQLRQSGWEADTLLLRYARGTRPERGRNLAIAEYPTANGPADYVLFIGLTPLAAVEAKRKNKDVSASLQQAKRYSRGFNPSAEMLPAAAQGEEYRLPFVFSTNGRPFLRQMETRSGIWFNDLRRAENLAHALDGWYTPQGLSALLKRDEEQANQLLTQEPFNFGFNLRPYQQKAIQAIEGGLGKGQRAMLLAMATGTGKTKTCIALIYRLLKVQRFQRVLFLVDREALGIQATNAFKDTRMDSIQSFADIFSVMELDEQTPDSDTAVHVATIQGMVRRILYSREKQPPPPIDRYDCIVVDECHRGYLLDRELSHTELTFRSFEDYISKYRRVLDYFDAVKIGLTATPALHTTEIFGAPIYTYGYREAVIDGYLIDHEPPVQLTTELSKYGIKWERDAEIPIYHPRRNQIELFRAPDEVNLEVGDFNRKVITEAFNQVICEYLARELDPNSRQKTLIFCANDAHADLVVALLKQAFQQQYGSIEDDAVIKITGKADDPNQLIRRYKNERNPNVAVTVDLLTTGVDVPEICNLVFLRRVNSRILFDQMLGRATRLCDEVGKQTFRIFDAVRMYEAIQDMTDMQPVVNDPKLSFTQLIAELATAANDEQRTTIRDQLLAKLQRKKRGLNDQSRQDFETAAGMTPEDFIHLVRQMPLAEITGWFAAHGSLSEILDRHAENERPILISDHPDRLLNVEHGYGLAQRPEDYLQAFRKFIEQNQNAIPALVTVLTRPRELTRKQLRDLVIELDNAGFSEVNLVTAWREMTNQEMAAHIVGFIRHIATGDTLVSYESRVDWALQQMLAARPWTNPQREWLKRIASQTKANQVVDRAALDEPSLIFHREGGGFDRLNRIFDSQLTYTLDTFNDLLWSYPPNP